MQAHIEHLSNGHDLDFEQARQVAKHTLKEATDAQIGALLAAMRTKGRTEHEIAGFAAGMRDVARTIDPEARPLVDTCGTGGDAYDTINVSTASAIVAAGAGVAVAKHGNYSVSSACGSADVLAEVGVAVDAPPATVERSIDTHGIGFMLAPVFHPAMKAVLGPRQELGMRTIFNVLGPLTNPAGANYQVVGVYAEHLVETLATALARLDVDRALVCHGGGLDEIALHDRTRIAEVRGDQVETYGLTPEDLGLSRAPLAAVAGGTTASNATILRDIVMGRCMGAQRDIVLANAAAALYISDVVPSLAAGVDRAAQAIDAGHAAQKLACLREEALEA